MPPKNKSFLFWFSNEHANFIHAVRLKFYLHSNVRTYYVWAHAHSHGHGTVKC
jgi:hypothetical protein